MRMRLMGRRLQLSTTVKGYEVRDSIIKSTKCRLGFRYKCSGNFSTAMIAGYFRTPIKSDQIRYEHYARRCPEHMVSFQG